MEAERIFKKQFMKDSLHNNYEPLQCIPIILTEEDRNTTERYPDEAEIRAAIFDLNKKSASRVDEFSGEFFQTCWEIVKHEVIQAVMGFFCGAELPRYITHTTLVLIPKKEVVRSFGDLRPISLSTFMNKVILKVLHGRINKVLYKIISSNQTGFMKGREYLRLCIVGSGNYERY